MDVIIEFKVAATEWSGLARDAMHIYVALIVFLAACLRWRAWQWQPWFVVLLVALIGEAIDMQDSLKRENRTFLWGNWHDLWNTMLLPTVLMLAARYTKVFAPRTTDVAEEKTSSDQSEM